MLVLRVGIILGVMLALTEAVRRYRQNEPARRAPKPVVGGYYF